MTAQQTGKPDINNAEFILYLGAFPGHSGKPMQTIARQAAIRLVEGKTKIAVVDPVMAGGVINPLVPGAKWVPIIPTTDGAFGMAMIQWIIENKKYNETFLASPTLEKAQEKGYNGWCNASLLVIVDPSHPNNGKMLRAADLGLEIASDEQNQFVVMDKASNKPMLAIASDAANITFEGEVVGKDQTNIKVKTAFLMLKATAFQKSMAEYAADCGIPIHTIETIAKDFTSHGTKVAVDTLGGTASVNGLNLTYTLSVLAALVGSMNRKGGNIERRHSYRSLADGNRYKLSTIEGRPASKGLRISRTGIQYESTDEYKMKVANGINPYPSKLPWHPIGGASDNQMLFSVVNQYPYSAKIFMNWMASPFFAIPGGSHSKVLDAFKNPAVLPLIITVDCYMGEVAALSDYFVPDTTPYESWGTPNIEGNASGKGNSVRWPVIKPATMKLEDGRHASFEAYLIDIAKSLGMPGFGEEAISSADGKKYPLNDAADIFLKGFANMAYDDSPVPDISANENNLQDLDARLAPYKQSLTDEEWLKVKYVISRGGRFLPSDSGFAGENHILLDKKCYTLYNERLTGSKHPVTGKASFLGTPAWEKESLMNGTLLEDAYDKAKWPFKSANYKDKYRSVTMMANSKSLVDMNLSNSIELNTTDAAALGIITGDKIKVTPYNGEPFIGNALVRPGIVRGTLAVTFGYGHWEYGSRAITVAGSDTVDGISERSAGVHLSSSLDPTVDGIFGVSEPITGGPGRHGGLYRIDKI